MTWAWSGRGAKSGTYTNGGGETKVPNYGLGGQRGTVSDAQIGAAWPNYRLQYLANGTNDDPDLSFNKYAGGDGASYLGRAVAHQLEVAKYSAADADAELKAEFNDWLQGNHKDNGVRAEYANNPGEPQRRWTYMTTPKGGAREEDPDKPNRVGDVMEGWRPTWWGNAQLTHLPGVRDYLRSQQETANNESLQMNLLAEHGPQNLEQAWMYFKHWVKAQPSGHERIVANQYQSGKRDATSSDPRHRPASHGGFGMHKPDEFRKPAKFETSGESGGISQTSVEPVTVPEGTYAPGGGYSNSSNGSGTAPLNSDTNITAYETSQLLDGTVYETGQMNGSDKTRRFEGIQARLFETPAAAATQRVTARSLGKRPMTREQYEAYSAGTNNPNPGGSFGSAQRPVTPAAAATAATARSLGIQPYSARGTAVGAYTPFNAKPDPAPIKPPTLLSTEQKANLNSAIKSTNTIQAEYGY